MSDAAPHRGGFPNVGDVAKQDRHVTAGGHHGSPKVVDRLCTSERADGPFDRALRHDAARGIEVGFLDGMQNVVEADQPCRHPLGIELNLELPQIAAEPLNGGDAWHRK